LIETGSRCLPASATQFKKSVFLLWNNKVSSEESIDPERNTKKLLNEYEKESLKERKTVIGIVESYYEVDFSGQKITITYWD